MNAKIERAAKEIHKTKERINEFQARLRELENQKTELENIEIVEAVRSMNVPLSALPVILKALRNANGAPLTLEQEGAPTEPLGAVGRGSATERADFGPDGAEEAKRSLQRRGPMLSTAMEETEE